MSTRLSLSQLAIGGALGLVVGLLVAPRPGQETRAMLIGEGERLKWLVSEQPGEQVVEATATDA